jgi:hypothetical protein
MPLAADPDELPLLTLRAPRPLIARRGDRAGSCIPLTHGVRTFTRRHAAGFGDDIARTRIVKDHGVCLRRCDRRRDKDYPRRIGRNHHDGVRLRCRYQDDILRERGSAQKRSSSERECDVTKLHDTSIFAEQRKAANPHCTQQGVHPLSAARAMARRPLHLRHVVLLRRYGMGQEPEGQEATKGPTWSTGAQQWTWKQGDSASDSRILELLHLGMSNADVATEMVVTDQPCSVPAGDLKPSGRCLFETGTTRTSLDMQRAPATWQRNMQRALLRVAHPRGCNVQQRTSVAVDWRISAERRTRLLRESGIDTC